MLITHRNLNRARGAEVQEWLKEHPDAEAQVVNFSHFTVTRYDAKDGHKITRLVYRLGNQTYWYFADIDIVASVHARQRLH